MRPRLLSCFSVWKIPLCAPNPVHKNHTLQFILPDPISNLNTLHVNVQSVTFKAYKILLLITMSKKQADLALLGRCLIRCSNVFLFPKIMFLPKWDSWHVAPSRSWLLRGFSKNIKTRVSFSTVELSHRSKEVPFSQGLLLCEIILWSWPTPLWAAQPTPTSHRGVQWHLWAAPVLH